MASIAPAMRTRLFQLIPAGAQSPPSGIDMADIHVKHVRIPAMKVSAILDKIFIPSPFK
jgi:hypothetical protein